jgi:hypothetical protein
MKIDMKTISSLLQAGKEPEGGIEDRNRAEVLRPVERVVDDGARNLDEVTSEGFRNGRLGDVELAGLDRAPEP